MLNELEHGCERNYILSGKAILTAQSLKTGKHFTYRIKAKDKNCDYFYVSVLSGPEFYTYLGFLCKTNGEFFLRSTSASKVSTDAPSFRGFDFIVERYLNHDNPHPKMRLSHSGRCGRCGRELTEPFSLKTGLGPYCITLKNKGI